MFARDSYFRHPLKPKRMLWLVPAVGVCIVPVLLVFTTAPSGQAQIPTTNTAKATLSCADGHSVIFEAGQTELTSLLADVLAINASGTGTTCSLTTAAIDPSAETAEWTVYDYNPSDRAIAPRNSPNSMPATTTGGSTWTFPFLPNTYTALFTTRDPNLTGDLSTKTLSATISVSGDAASFMTQNGGGNCVNNVPAAVRFYFTSPSASGPSVGTPPAGFYTQFWWSNPVNLQLLAGNQSATIIAHMLIPAEWSDWNGQSGSNPAVTAAFMEATHKVQAIGLSFGGECFFETGVTPTGAFTTEQFTSMFSEN
ncbi:MAG TPA: hypothetical protein VN879_20410 [Candidatus Acidoferrales bacterium]|nr:hypothetical protein [Candidatus Acidoferrales bacterium]